MVTQTEVIVQLGVAPTFDAVDESEGRTAFLKNYLVGTGLSAYVLGISGGVDSTTAAMLAQRAVSELRAGGYSARFIAVRLPYGVQADEQDAAAAIEAIGADQVITVNIKESSDSMWQAVKGAGLRGDGTQSDDVLLGNIKARQRMVAQYAIAGASSGLVIGTDHAAEAVMGFFTKFGDGAADILPLAGLNKRRIRAIAAHLGVPGTLVSKTPTADLEDNAPLRPDEEAYGVSYDQIDDFLEGKTIDESAQSRILRAYNATAHKRSLPVAANGG
nr:ammonia-dependent NAD(+) synthetase [uncultured Devosia sp.]